jgi:HEPN domain-containing protein/predicted nucleotidyltransferase
MKRSLRHLSIKKQNEIQYVVDVLSRIDNVEMIILYGSYARGDFVEDTYAEGHIVYEYQSDYDIHVIVNDEHFASDTAVWHDVNQKIRLSHNVKTPVSVIVDDIFFVNEQLSLGRYFYSDIKKEGIKLFDTKNYKLAKVKKMTWQQKKSLAQIDYDLWNQKAEVAWSTYKFAIEHGHLAKAAFELHQTTECLLTTVLLVYTGYRPKSHDIEKFINQARPIDERFFTHFPQSSDEERRLFLMLKNAYIDARYKRDYNVKQTELDYLAFHMNTFKTLIHEVCRGKIEKMGPKDSDT